MRFLAPLAAILLAIPVGSIQTQERTTNEEVLWVHNQVLDVRDGVVHIGLGADDFLQGGEQYIVFRGSRYVATIEVDVVFPRHAFAHAIEELDTSFIQVGDELMFPIESPVEPDFEVR